MKRGDLISVAVSGDYGKPRPALVIQSDAFPLDSVTILLVTSKLVEAPLFRISIEPDDENHLTKPSFVMVDKIMTIRREKTGNVFGHVDETTLRRIESSLAVFLGIAR